MSEGNKNINLVIRLNKEERAKLDFVVSVYGISQSDLIRNIISSEYDNLKGSPELAKAMSDLEKIKEILTPYSNS